MGADQTKGTSGMNEDETSSQLPGLTAEHFDAAVDALAALRADGKFLAFLSRYEEVRFIGNVEEFCAAFAGRLPDEEIDTKHAKTALTEMTSFLETCLWLETADRVASFLEAHPFEEAFKKAEGKQEQQRLRDFLRAKAKAVMDKLVTDSLIQRRDRIATSAAALVEDLDVEVVASRKDHRQGREVRGPFLRLRLCYSDGSAFDNPLVRALNVPWAPRRSCFARCKSNHRDAWVLR